MDTVELKRAVALYLAALPPGELEDSVEGMDAVA